MTHVQVTEVAYGQALDAWREADKAHQAARLATVYSTPSEQRECVLAERRAAKALSDAADVLIAIGRVRRRYGREPAGPLP